MSVVGIKKQDETCELCDQPVARARSVIELARGMLVKCMEGKVDPRTGETQRKAALDILDADSARRLSDSDLLAEVKRRGLGLAGKGKPDLDAAEAAVLGCKHG